MRFLISAKRMKGLIFLFMLGWFLTMGFAENVQAGKLFAVISKPPLNPAEWWANSLEVVSLDLTTQPVTSTPITTILNRKVNDSGDQAPGMTFDPINQRFYMVTRNSLTTTTFITAVNTQTGKIEFDVAVNPFDNDLTSDNKRNIFLEFDPVRKELLAVISKPPLDPAEWWANSLEVVSLDLTTQPVTSTPITTILNRKVNDSGDQAPGMTFDPINQRFYMVTRNSLTTTTYITVVNTKTGITTDPIEIDIPVNDPSNDLTSDNKRNIFLEFDPVRKELLAVISKPPLDPAEWWANSLEVVSLDLTTQPVTSTPITTILNRKVNDSGDQAPGMTFDPINQRFYMVTRNSLTTTTYITVVNTKTGITTDPIEIDIPVNDPSNDLTSDNKRNIFLESDPGQAIFIDWDSPVSTDFQVKHHRKYGPIGVPDCDKSGICKGTEPKITAFPPNFRKDVEKHVSDIFNNSGLSEISILSSLDGTPQPSDALVVRFAPLLEHDLDSAGNHTGTFKPLGLLGKAWNIVPKGGSPHPVIDRFNLRRSGEVAVFANPGAIYGSVIFNAELVAGTVAHEIGHGLGLWHINPDGLCTASSGPPCAKSVMDYDRFSPDIEEFYDQRTDRCKRKDLRSSPDCSASGLGTHNPRYHLRRFSLAESRADVTGGGLVAGGWDEGVFTIRSVKINTIDLNSFLFNLNALPSVEPIDDPEDLTDDTIIPIAIADSVDPGNFSNLEFLTSPDSPFEIVGSSMPDHPAWDLYFGFGDPANPILTFGEGDTGTLAGSIFQFSEATQSFAVVGSFSATIEDIATISPDDFIAVNPKTLDFGPVEIETPKDLSFSILNSGEEILNGACSVASPFILPEGCSFSLSPGQTKSVPIRFTPTDKGSIVSHIIVSSNGGDAVLSIRGEGIGDGDDPDQLVQQLIVTVEGLGIKEGIKNSLVKKLENALKQLRKGQIQGAIGKLNAFINEVRAKKNKEIPPETADALIAEAQRILAIVQP